MKKPKLRHHLDRRADQILAMEPSNNGKPPHDDDLLTTIELADWLRCSVQFLEIGRCKNYGPPFVQLATRTLRYRRGDVRAWLKKRAYACTSQYSKAKA